MPQPPDRSPLSPTRAALLVFAVLCAGVARSAFAQAEPARIDSARCIGCHAQPSKKFHADPTHKKFDCIVCHAEAAAHVADNKTKPKLVQDDKLCSSCHALKPRK